MNRAEFKIALDDRIKQTEKLRSFFSASALQKVLHYPLRVTLAKFFFRIFPDLEAKFLVRQKLFTGDEFWTEGYYLDYYLCGYITDSSEELTTRYVLANLPESGEFFDIGSHYGFYSLLAKAIAPNLKIHAFEPAPETFKILQKNLSKSGAVLNNFALSSSIGKQEFAVFKDRSLDGSNSLYVDEALSLQRSDAYRKIAVQTETLDSYCHKSGAAPAFIKLDVEGAEADVIKGGLQSIQKFHPQIIMEIWPKGHNARHLQALQLLQQAGYGFERLLEGGAVESVSIAQLENWTQVDNVICRVK